MPTPDASAFTRQKKLSSISNQVRTSDKVVTHLYQYVPKTSALIDFLPSFTNKIVMPYTLSVPHASVGPHTTQFNGYRPKNIR